MTFDVSELSGRAQSLKEKAIDVFVQACVEGGGQYAGMAIGTYQDLAEKQFAEVDHIYDDFLSCPDPGDFKSATDLLGQAMGDLAVSGWQKDPAGGESMMGEANTDLSGVTTTGDYMADWTGDAAATFKTNFADKFEGVTSNQFTLAAVARQAINAEAAIWETVRNDLDKVSKDALEKMDQCLEKTPSEWNMTFTVAAAVVAVAAVPATGGTSLELAFAVAGAGLSVVATGVSGSGGSTDTVGLETGSPERIVSSLVDVLDKIKDYITEHETTINTNVKQTTSAIDAAWDRMCLPRPDYAEAQGHRYDDPRYAGQSNG